MSDKELVSFDSGQFAQIMERLTASGNEAFAINDTLKLIRHAILDQTTDTGKWLATLNDTLSAGLAEVAKAIREQLPPPPPAHPLEVKFVFIVADDHQDEPFAIAIDGVTDAEGNAIPDAKGLTVAVTSSDTSIVGVTFDATANTGVASFGSPGVASLNATVSNAKGDILGSGAADFTVTTGDPAAVSSVKIAFSGLTETP